MDDRPHRASDLCRDLGDLGVTRGDVVMVHASLRAIGPVAGGADGVIDAIRMALGDSGTMVMLLGARDDLAWVNRRPEPERAALLRDAEPFDAHRTPADPDVGVLAEVLRWRPETRVSDHPEARFAAAGPLAAELLSDVPWDDYFGPGSTLDRLVERRGRILRLGADRDTVTALHLAEYRCAVWPKRRIRRHRRVAAAGGPTVRVVESLDDEAGIVEVEGDDYFAAIVDAYLEAGRGRVGRVGRARSELFDAADIVDFGTRWMDEQLVDLAADTWASRLRQQLDADLLAARRRGRHAEIAAIRGLKSALANAEAVPVEDGPYRPVEGRADVPRRELTPADMLAVLGIEIAERERAIAEYEAIQADPAALRVELATLRRYRDPA